MGELRLPHQNARKSNSCPLIFIIFCLLIFQSYRPLFVLAGRKQRLELEPSSQISCSPKDFKDLKYNGTQCHSSNIWPYGPCPVAGACVPECSRCLQWRRGLVLLAAEASHDPNHFATSTSRPCDGTLWAFGSWRGEAWSPSPSYPQCSNRTLSRGAIYKCLRGRRVMLFGDSMIRPLLGRLVTYLRGISQYVEHMYHGLGAYYMANGTHDAFVEGGFLPRLYAKGLSTTELGSLPTAPEADWDPRGSMELQFYWAPYFTEHEEEGHTVPSLSKRIGVLAGADVIIAGPMYHDNGQYEVFRRELEALFTQLAAAGKRVSYFFWVSTIPSHDNHEERNRRMRAFVEMLNTAALHGDSRVPRSSYYVDAARMAHSAPVNRSDRHHFQCSKHGPFPAALLPGMRGIAADKDCRDVFNLNMVQSILKVLCSGLEVDAEDR